jgi:hypothetical protein
MGPDAGESRVWIHKAFATVPAQFGREQALRISSMSISSVPPSAPAKPPEPVEVKAPDVKPDTNSDAAAAYQPPAQAPLPPGQGTRIDQIA